MGQRTRSLRSRLLGWKLALLTHRFEIPDNQDIEFVQIVAAPALAWGIVDFGIVFPLAVLGLARVPRTRVLVVPEPGHGARPGGDRPVLCRRALSCALGSGIGLARGRGGRRPRSALRHGDWRGLAWRLGLLGLPAVLLSWRPQADPVPTRWGNQLIALALADLRAGQLDSAIDALDLARRSSPETAERSVKCQRMVRFTTCLSRRSIGARQDLESRRAGTRANVHQGRLLRQLPERTAQARSLLEASLRSIPNDATANREWGALLLSWPERPLDRDRALEALERASRGREADDRATLLLALTTSNPALLKRPAAVTGGDRNRFATLVRAMLASGQSPFASAKGSALSRSDRRRSGSSQDARLDGVPPIRGQFAEREASQLDRTGEIGECRGSCLGRCPVLRWWICVGSVCLGRARPGVGELAPRLERSGAGRLGLCQA